MKIAVCVKSVPEGNSRIDPGTNRLDRSGEGALNAFDANAVEEALQLKDATGEGEVVVVSLGPAKAQDALRKALAMGADRAVLVSDETAAGSDLVATSSVLAKALEREGADLVLFGQQARDSDGAVLWAAVADRLPPWATGSPALAPGAACWRCRWLRPRRRPGWARSTTRS